MSKESGTLLERAYVDVLYVLGSFACCHSDNLAESVIGSKARATLWHRTVTPANSVILKYLGEDGGLPPRFTKPKDLPWAAELTVDAISLRGQQQGSGGVPAIAFRPIGNILVAGEIFGHEHMGDLFGIGMRYNYDPEVNDGRGLGVLFGLYHAGTRQFDPANAETIIEQSMIDAQLFQGRPLQ